MPFDVTETSIPLRGIDPSHDGLRIAQISDVHIGTGTPASRILEAVRLVNEARPDLVFLTGDYVTHSREPIRRMPLLAGLQAPVFAVLGNHDHWVDARGVRKAIEALGYTVLQNAHARLRARGGELAIVGVDDDVSGHADVAQAFHGAPTAGTRLVLAHAPPTADLLPARANLLCFSGHTHGGQFNVPVATRFFFRLAGQPYVKGLYQVRGNHLYVNCGLGFGGRFRARPELSFFTLRAA